jgi:hypothetical protein
LTASGDTANEYEKGVYSAKDRVLGREGVDVNEMGVTVTL